MSLLAERLHAVEERIAAACRRHAHLERLPVPGPRGRSCGPGFARPACTSQGVRATSKAGVSAKIPRAFSIQRAAAWRKI